MRELLLTFSTPALLLLIVGGSALLTSAAIFFLRRVVDEKIHQANNEVAGFLFAGVAVMYGVLLAFMVLVVWEMFESSRVTVEHEANTLVSVFRLSQEIPDPASQFAQTLAIEYAQQVVNQEWDAMAYGKSSASVDVTMEKLWEIYRSLGADSLVDRQQYFETLAALASYRRVRLLDSRTEIPQIMWGLLICGGIITIGFTFFFRAPNFKAHLMMGALFAGLVAFILLLIIDLDNPFTGDVKIQPTAFLQILELLQELRGN